MKGGMEGRDDSDSWTHDRLTLNRLTFTTLNVLPSSFRSILWSRLISVPVHHKYRVSLA